MTHFAALCFQILHVTEVCFHFQRNPAGHGQSIAFQAGYLPRIVGQQSDGAEAKIREDLSAGTIVTRSARRQGVVCLHGVFASS